MFGCLERKTYPALRADLRLIPSTLPPLVVPASKIGPLQARKGRPQPYRKDENNHTHKSEGKPSDRESKASKRVRKRSAREVT